MAALSLEIKSKKTYAMATLAIMALAMLSLAPVLADDSDASVITTSQQYALRNGETLSVDGIFDNGASLGDYTFQLPAGFSVTGTIGNAIVNLTCGQEVSAGDYTITMKRTVNGTEYTRLHTIYVNSDCTSPYEGDTLHYAGKVGENLTIDINDGDSGYIIVDAATITAGRIVPGMSLSHDDDGFTISGSPTASGLYVATVVVDLESDDGVGTATHTIVIDVSPTASFNVSDLSVYSGQNISRTVCTENLTSVSGAPWLHITGGTVYGTAPSPGVYNVTVYSGSSSASFKITVVSALQPTNSPTAGLLVFEL